MGWRAQIALTLSCVLFIVATIAPSASAQSCNGGAARTTITSFVAAFNGGDYERLDALFAHPPTFEWFSQNRPGRRLGAQAKDRDSLIPYFHARHTAGERLGFVSLQANTGNSSRRNFGLMLRRKVPGFRHGAWFRIDAKGVIECSAESVTLIVLSLGAPQGEGVRAQARS